MTQKELAYTEDAVSHENIIISIIEDNVNNLKDESLISFMNKELNMHNEIKQRLMNLLEDKINE